MKTIIFDFDYTLADSSAGVIDCTAFALRELGLPPASDKMACQAIGLSLPDTLVYLVGPQYAKLGAEFTRLFVQRADQVMTNKTVLFEFVPHTIKTLKKRGLTLGIVSTKYRYRIEDILQRENLRLPFAGIIGGEDVTRHKPDPQSLHLALKQFGGDTQSTLYVGDSITDAKTARRAAVPFVAVLSGTTPRAAFQEYAPVHILDHVGKLPAILD